MRRYPDATDHALDLISAILGDRPYSDWTLPANYRGWSDWSRLAAQGEW